MDHLSRYRNLLYYEDSSECFRCNKKTLIFDNHLGEIVCRICGHVVMQKINSREPDRKDFSDDGEDRRRTGDSTSITRHDMGLSTMINSSNRDASGRMIPFINKKTADRIRLWDKKIIYTSNRNLIIAFSELVRIKEKLGLPEPVIEKAAYFYRKAVEKTLTRGRMINSLVAASLYLACRYSGTPYTINDITRVTNVKRKELTKCYRLLLREFDYVVPLQDPIKCVSKIANNLGISEKTKRFAVNLMQKVIRERTISGKDPMGIAAAILYLSCLEMNEFHSQKIIALSSNVSEITIRNQIKILK